MSRRFQFSLSRLMGAVGIFALGLWLLRAALDSERPEAVIAAVIGLPIILGTAVGRLFGNAITGAVSVALTFWLLAMLFIGMAVVAAMISQLAKWTW